MIRTVYGCPATAPHPAHDWTAPRFGRVSCDGIEPLPATLARDLAAHINPPHDPGSLIGCLACEERCHCNPGIGWHPGLNVEPCVYCVEQKDAFPR